MRTHILTEELIGDLKLCISYTKDPEQDLQCMMRQYLKSRSDRPQLKINLQKLLNGQPYQNPFESFYFYSDREIDTLHTVLQQYLLDMVDYPNKYTVMTKTITEINALHEQCSNELIDDWRAEMLDEILLDIAHEVGFEPAYAVLMAHKGW